MKRISFFLLVAVLAVAASPVSAAIPRRPTLFEVPVPPPPRAVDATAAAARRVLHKHGIVAIRGLGLIGDYWEAEGLRRGQPVVAYLFTDGKLAIDHASRRQMMAAFGELPERG